MLSLTANQICAIFAFAFQSMYQSQGHYFFSIAFARDRDQNRGRFNLLYDVIEFIYLSN